MADEQEGRLQRKEKWTQAVVSLSVGLIFITVGLPLWWNTTKVYRASLPYSDIELLTRLKLTYQVHINVLLPGHESTQQLDVIQNSLSEQLNSNKDTTVSSRYKVTVVSLISEEKALLNKLNERKSSFPDLDEALQGLWSKQSLPNRTRGDGHYTFIILPDGLFSHLKHIYIGKYSHTLIPHQKDMSLLLHQITRIVNDVYVNTRAVHDAFSVASARSFKKHDIKSMRAQKSVSEYLDPFLQQFPHLDISVDSQVLHYSAVGVGPKTDSSGYYLSHEDLPHMINPVEAKLGSYVSLHPNLNFIVYVPAQEHYPLQVRTKDGKPSKSNAFLSPQWGGILVYNVNKPTNDSQPERVRLDTQKIMTVFISQLKLLLGVIPVDPPADISLGDYSSAEVTEWERYSLLRVKTMEYLATSTITLTSLARLLEKIGNMVIGDQIKTQVEQALLAIDRSKKALEQGSVTSAFLEAKTAILSSEKAFFDPSILALLYFPDDQKYAIYIPLFLPVSVPVLLSLKDGIVWLRAKMRKDITKDEQEENRDNKDKKE